MNLADALRIASQRFDSDSAALDAQLLLCAVLDVPRSRLYSHPEQELSSEEQQRYEELCIRREAGEPMAYILGTRSFWRFDLEVAPGVLIPRPETELLVEIALELGSGRSGRVADLGTGSGAIALALASERADWRVVAVEKSPVAARVAARNFEAARLLNLELREGSWCEPLQERDYLLIVSNPPYLAPEDPHLNEGDLRFEPTSALVAEQDGYADLRHLADTAQDYLAPEGWLLMEHGWEQGAVVRTLLGTNGFAEVSTYRDTAGRERVTVGKKPGVEA